MYDGFDNRLSTLTANITIPALPDENLTDLWQAWVDAEQFFPGIPPNNQAPPPPTEIEPGKVNKLEHLEDEPRYTWIHVFHAGGWATKIGTHGGA